MTSKKYIFNFCSSLRYVTASNFILKVAVKVNFLVCVTRGKEEDLSLDLCIFFAVGLLSRVTGDIPVGGVSALHCEAPLA